MGGGVSFALSMTPLITGDKVQPFVSVTVNELLFGYEDTLVNMAHIWYPRHIRPTMSKMGLLLGVSCRTFSNSMHSFDSINCRRIKTMNQCVQSLSSVLHTPHCALCAYNINSKMKQLICSDINLNLNIL